MESKLGKTNHLDDILLYKKEIEENIQVNKIKIKKKQDSDKITKILKRMNELNVTWEDLSV